MVRALVDTGRVMLRRSTCVEKGFGVTSGLSSEESHKGSRQASTAAHNVIPGLPRPLHVIQQVAQPQLWQPVQLWRGFQQDPAAPSSSKILFLGLPPDDMADSTVSTQIVDSNPVSLYVCQHPTLAYLKQALAAEEPTQFSRLYSAHDGHMSSHKCT